jgi:hypothetical protein
MRTRVAIIRPAAIVLFAAIAACSGGSPGSPSLETSGPWPVSSQSGAPSSARSPYAPASTLSPTPGSSGTPTLGSPTTELPADPPFAMLEGPARISAAGELGTASWGGTTTDAPWIVGPSIGQVAAGTPLTVTFDPSIRPWAWQARWAPLDGRDVGTPQDGGSDAGKLISVTAPGAAGDWSLQVQVRFGPDTSGAWYWRIQVER